MSNEGMNTKGMGDTLIEVKDLQVAFKVEKELKSAVHGVSFTIARGEKMNSDAKTTG